MNRIDRISAILIQLQSRRVVRACDIADRFSISLRTVYRDVKTLEEAGIPIIGEAGVGYSIMDGYRLPPVMFTKEEATAFLTAEKFVEKMTDGATMAHHQSAMYKIRAVLRTADKNLLEDLDNHIVVFEARGNGYNGIYNNSLQPMLHGIANKNVLSLHYFAQHNQQRSVRLVEPVGVFFLSGYWHLIAFCRLRKDYRDFRVDRISQMAVTGERFDAKHPTLTEYIALMKKERELSTVIIMVDKSTASHLNEQKYYSGFVSECEKGDQLEMTFLTASLEGFARWFMMFGDHAKIVTPDKLVERVKEILGAISKNVL